MDSIIGITGKDWFRLLRSNKFSVTPQKFPKSFFITLLSFRNSIYKRKEEKLFGEVLKSVELTEDPIFILGHWRSGTTFLQNMLIQDERFAFTKIFEVNNPHAFLFLGQKFQKVIESFERKERPMDRVIVNKLSPGEEEFALAVLTLKSPLLGWLFPKNMDYYSRYLTFREVPEIEINEWKNAFLSLCRKLTYKYQKQLLLKSPANTARIKLLLELFPQAKFIHVHRNPLRVFQSTKKLYQIVLSTSRLQNISALNLNETIIAQYKNMYDSFFEQRSLIPERNMVETKYEDLVQQPEAEVEKVYDALGMSGFTEVRPQLKQYLQSLGEYRKNHYQPLEKSLENRLRKAWGKYFELWGYSV